ncbi:MAG TPA: hypothetical protein VGR26_07215, partial [Acidimicrobiales bacterium]|nr:hypothetical protein [Acidimicrobiales bacterium]
MPVLLCVMAGLLLGGCGGGDGTPVSQPSEVPPSIHTTPPISAVEPGEAALRSTVDERAEQRFALPGGPDWLAADDDAVWVKRDEGTVDRIDPATNEITSLWVPPREEGKLGPVCQGIGAGPEGVWACTGGGIARIAPDNSAIVSTVAVQKIFDQGHIGVGHGHAWILTGDGSTLVGVSSETDTIETTIDLGARCTDLDLSDDALWIVCLPEDLVLR